MTKITAQNVAEQTWEWLADSGRIDYGAIRKIEESGLDAFLATVAEKWEDAGRPRFMEGMKEVIMKEIHPA